MNKYQILKRINLSTCFYKSIGNPQLTKTYLLNSAGKEVVLLTYKGSHA